jgi:arylsulfatase A-like enzyme
MAVISARSSLSLYARNTSAEKPNFLILVVDDLRRDALGYNGNPIVQTPVIDCLAKEGVRFDNAFVTSPSNISQPGTFTGIHERTHGYAWNSPSLPAVYTDTSYPQLLRSAGYRTGLVGKFSFRVAPEAPEKMFDSFVQVPRYPFMKVVNGKKRQSSEFIGDLAVEFLKECVPGQPFALTINFNDAHAADRDARQYWWPASTDLLYRDIEIPPLGSPTADPAFFEKMPWYLTTHFDRQRWWQRYWCKERYQEMIKGYYRIVTGVDIAIGRLRDELKRRGLNEDTIVILTSENGTFHGERGFGGKYLIYDVPLRVPLIIYNPRQTQGRGQSVQELTLNLDIAPTILGLSGVENPSWMDGMNLVPLMESRKPKWREGFLCQHLSGLVLSVLETEGYRTKRWKYLRYLDFDYSEELYDLADDPDEARNLASKQEFQTKLYEMRNLCNDAIREAEEKKKNPGTTGWQPWTSSRPAWQGSMRRR